MTKEEFLIALEDILQRENPCLENDTLNDYDEWDSLSKMSIMAYYSQNFGIQLTLQQFKEIQTVSDLISLAGGNIQ